MRDAEHLARSALLGQIVPVRVPSPTDEAARDLVRAREDVRADLMRARRRISKLLLRHGPLSPEVLLGFKPYVSTTFRHSTPSKASACSWEDLTDHLYLTCYV
jgi:hypothetical protein